MPANGTGICKGWMNVLKWEHLSLSALMVREVRLRGSAR